MTPAQNEDARRVCPKCQAQIRGELPRYCPSCGVSLLTTLQIVSHFSEEFPVPEGYRIIQKVQQERHSLVLLGRETESQELAAITYHIAGRKMEREALRSWFEELKSLVIPGIPPILHMDLEAPTPILVRRWISGETLAERLEDGTPLSTRAVQELAIGVLEILDSLHGAGQVHGQLTSRSIVIDLEEKPHLVGTGQLRGVLATIVGPVLEEGVDAEYLAPENRDGRSQQPADDLYALASAMYLATTGRRPYNAPDPPALLETKSRVPPVAPSKLFPGISRRLSDLIVEALHPDPGNRPVNASEFQSRLREGDLVAELDDATPEPTGHGGTARMEERELKAAISSTLRRTATIPANEGRIPWEWLLLSLALSFGLALLAIPFLRGS